MTDKDKVIEYELQIESMLKALIERLSEFDTTSQLTDFEQGRQLAYQEMFEIIQTRYQMIFDILSQE
ncbi:MAG: hypothetical protein E7335_03400 [Clostridiales bacterium]|nr:hypothetical protein [Clostridiales bacterium]